MALLTRWRTIVTIGLVASIAGCVGEHALRPVSEPSSASECRSFIAAVDRMVTGADVVDAEAAPVGGFPYLRVDRLLVALRPASDSAAAFSHWLDRLRAFDRAGRAVELANLPSAQRALLPADTAVLIDRCAEQLRATELADIEARAALRDSVVVPDEYRTLWRAFGLYPLSSLFVAAGVRKYHAETHEQFRLPLAQLPVRGRLQRYAPATDAPLTSDQVAKLIASARANPLAIPDIDAAVSAQLFARFAPIFEIDIASADDEIGAPRWSDSAAPVVDTTDPVVYTRLSYVRYGQAILPQLNYVIWFSARPRTGVFDILGGHLDGLHWRVTLGPDGRVLLYDAMHNCGCFHMFFPTAALRARDAADAPEPPLLPQAGPVPDAAERVVLRLESGTHYLQRVYLDGNADGRRYRVLPYDALRSLDAGGGRRRSMFDADGIVPGTERRERWLIWPMGVPAPGAMRQWGHHATAFIGRRHFDDAELLERLFYPPAGVAR